ncbi:obscurin isoform X2 [Ixodes scapularis]|uniref:obscurin isoform X2 n=1 Tax=Ixodes scapularis TaxID=6945 RepID=UPI001A9F0E40|nr:obscurin isoform X2 [Ixodes scapularis]
MSYSRSSYRSSKYSEGISDDSFARSSARSSSLMDTDVSSASSLSSTRRTMRTTSYGDEGGSYSSMSTVRRSSRLSALDDDDIGSSSRIRSSTVRTSRLNSRNDDDFGSATVSRRPYGLTSADSFESSSRKSSLASSILGETGESATSRALRRLSKDDDKESYATKRSKLASKSSFDVDESTSSVRYSSTKISSSVESSDLGAASFVASKSSFSYKDSSSSGAAAAAEPSPIGGIFEAILDYKPISSDDEGIPLKEGQEVEVIDTSKPRKWRVRTRSSTTGITQEGWVPSCYLEKKEGAVVVEQVSPKDKESQVKREAVVKELVETEEDFSRDMQRVVNTYLKEMESPSMPKELKEQKDVLFSNFKDISDFHNTELIKGVQYNASEPAKLGVTFLRLERDFDKHVKYCEDFPRAQDLLASGPMKEYFDEFSKSINDDKCLSDHLKLPIQRINDYQLLLKELIKYTARLHEDFSDLQRALDFMQAIPQRASDLQYINAIEGYHGNIHNWGRVMKHTTESEIVDTGDEDVTLKILQRDASGEDVPITLRAKDKEQKREWAEELHASTIASEVVEEMQCEDTSIAERLQDKSAYSHTGSLSESTAVPVSPEPPSSSLPKTEILEGFEAYKEATSAATGSIRSGSVTSIDASRKDASGKPQFQKALRGLTCSQGDNLSLECEVSSPETPTVQWLKDNIPLKKSQRVETKEDAGKHKLLINEASVEDSGMYTIIASNPQGTASCSAPVYVKPGLSVSKGDSRPTSPGGTVLPHAPVFKVKLKDTELLEGTSVRFELVVRGCPEPEVTFYKNGKKLKEDDRVRVIYESKEVFELVIDHISFEDMGKYSCVAVNSEGKDESSGTITVTKDKILFQGLTGDFSAEGSHPLTPPPRSPAFRWFKDGQEFEASERFQVTFDDIEDNITLVFQHVTPDDAGLYTCVASTSSGKISCSAELTVQGSVIKKSPEAPTIHASLSDVEVNEGASAMLELKVTGYPKPKITWKHDGKVIEAGGRYRFLFEDEESMTLIIKNVTKADSGKYSVVAENELGSANTDCKLTVNSLPAFKKELKDVSVMTDEVLKLDVEVQGSPQPDVKWYKDGQAVIEDDRVKILHPAEDKHALVIDRVKVEDSGNYSCVISNTTGTQTGFSAVSVNAPPRFIQKLKNYEATETENVTFRIKVSGSPKPKVCWKKDGKEIKSNKERYQTLEEAENVHCLIIDDVRSEDVAEYSVEISNEYGTETDNASLTITCKPKIKKKFDDVECSEGERNIKLTIEVEGSPAPKVKWILNETEIREDESFKFESVEDSGKYTLVIKEAKSDMTGNLTCEAKNEKGKDSCTGSVTVKSKPRIIKGLEDIEVEVGEPATFTVKLADGKNVDVKWSKDDCDVVLDNKNIYAKEEADATFTLQIKNVKAEDAGKYTCKVKNELGEDSSTARMSTKSKPFFKKHLVNQEISEEEETVFSAEVGGHPKPSVKWFHGKREIKEDDVYKITSDEETYTLKVKKPNKELAGEYTCQAENSCGKEESSASLTIYSKPEIIQGMKDIEGEVGEAVSFNVKISGSPKPDIVWKRNGEEVSVEATVKVMDQAPSYTLAFDELTIQLAGDYECIAKNKYGTASTAGKLTVNSKPKFTKAPGDVCIYTGEECVFEAKVTGVPAPEVSWYKAGVKIEETERISITTHNGTHRLVIKECNRKDESDYTCTAKNSLGRVSEQAELTVKVPEDSEAPTFIRRMVDTIAITGDKARLEVRVAGKPTPTVTWYKNGEELTESKQVTITKDGDTHTVTFKDIVKGDGAKYSCKAENDKGEDEDNAKLIVKEPVAPLIDGLRNQEARIGWSATFEATISGLPAPDVVWKKDGTVLTPSENVVISADVETESYTVVIRRVEDDFGTYTCHASNSAGEDEAQAKLMMKGEAPSFIRKLVNTEVGILEEASFEARIKGYPTPSATWLLNDTVLRESETVSISEKGERYSLKISNVTSNEIGEVVCRAQNSIGQAESEAALSIKASAPVVHKGLPSKVRVDEGQPLKLEAKIPGHPLPDIQWLKDGEPVVPSNRVKLSQAPDGTVVLEVDSAKPGDAGHYTVVARNDQGKATSETDVETTPKGAEVPSTPAFSEGLKDATLTEGCPGKLEAKLSRCSPPPDVEWKKDGEPILPSDHMQPVQEPDGTVALKIDKVTPDDAGHYSIVAGNDEEKAISDADVKTQPKKAVQGEPVFEQGLKPTTLTEGAPGRLEAKVSPPATSPVEWTKDGSPVRPTDHVKLVEEPDGTVALELDKVGPDDAGHYAVKAVNDKGETSSEADIKTQPKSALVDKKPCFEKGLQPCTLTEGKPAQLEAKIAPGGTPTKVEWLKDGKPLKPSDHLTMQQKPDGTLALKIDNVTPEDAGHYAVVASNDDGKSASEGDVKTQPDEDRKAKKPAFEKGLEPTTLVEGKPAKLEAKLAPGSKPTSVKWLKDGRPIRPSDRVRQEEKPDGTLALLIDDVKPEDAGRYSVVASNDAGEVDSEAPVKTQPDEDTKRKKPAFEKGLEPATLLEGKPAKLEAKLAPGKPTSVKWLKDGLPIRPSDRVRQEEKPDGSLALIIDDVKPEDAGQYSVVASNDAGEAESEAPVKTMPDEAGKLKKPAFERELEPMTLTEGKPAKLEAKLAPGSKPTSVQWLKDGRPIRPSDRVRQEEKPDGTLALCIDDVKPEDAGRYSVVASNDAGEAESEAPVKTTPDEASKLKKPAFDKELEPMTLTEGKPAKLEAKLAPGSKPTSVKWFKDGRPIRPSDRVRQEEKPDGTLALCIDDVKPEDAGRYSVVASNDAGEAESEAPVKTVADGEGKLKKPAFEKELEPMTLAEGKPARLEAKLAPGSKPTSIKWYKNDRPIRPSERVKLEENPDGTLALTIDDVKPEDAGGYAVVAANDAGEADSEADIKTKPTARVPGEKPEFVIELKNAELLEGQPLHLVGKVKSDSPFTVEWLKDGEPLKTSSGLSFSQEPDGTVILSIDHATPDDSGKYVCVATNPDGKARSSSTVNVKEMPKYKPEVVDELKPTVFTEGEPGKLEAKVSGEPMPDVKWIKDGQELPDDSRIRSTTSPGGDVALTIDPVKPEDAGKYALVAANDEGECRTSAPVTVNQPPRFTTPLEPVEAVEGYPARLEAKLSGQPTPETEWKKDGKPFIPDGEKIKESKTPSGDVALIIPKTQPEDAGVYSCKAKNPFGEQETKAPLTVAGADTSGEPEEKPTVSPIADVNVMESEPFTLETKVTGKPLPEVQWLLDGKPVSTSDNVQQSFDGRKAKLYVKNSRPKDAGQYECRASNPAGKASATSTVGVTAMSKPRFTKRLTDTEGSPNEPLTLVAKVEGNPEPEITWKYNGKVIEPSIKYNMSKEGDTCTLTIPWPQSKDSGVYECLAKNPVGEDKCQAQVTMREKADKGEPPCFLKRLENVEVPEGDTARFTARIAGSPLPEVKWFKDGEELERTPRHKFELGPDGTLRLTIRDCRPEDLGEYRASIYNPYGSDSSMGTLRVKSPHDTGKRRSIADKYPEYEKPDRTEPGLGSAPSPYEPPQLNGYASHPGGDRRREPYGAPYSHELPPAEPYPSHRPFDRPDYTPHSRQAPHPEYDDLDRPHDRRYKPSDQYEPYSAGVPAALTDKPYIRRMTDRDLTLGWKPYIPSGSRVPVTYNVEMAPLPDGNWAPYKSGTRDTQLDIRGLEPFKDYRFRVRVGNKYGLSDPSPYVTAHRSRLGGPPPVPKEFKPKDYELEHPPLDKQGTAPYFVRREEDTMYGIQGHPVSIEFWVYGYPQPNITWTFKGTKIEMGGRYNCMQDRNGQVTLFISRMTEDNVGSYTCTAVNEHGEAMKSIYLELAEEPVFTKRLEPTTIMLRRGGELQCRAIGKPYPKIKWFKDWQPICNSSRVNIIWEAPDICTLTLNDSISRDAGLYSCSASNIAGTTSCSAILTIEESQDEFDLNTYRQPKLVRPRSKHIDEYYNLGDELGRGTQGVVYHAVERPTGKNYAAKMMHGKGQFKDWMKAELDMMNQLCHPRLVRLWDAFETKNSMSLITDLCGGGELLDNIISRDKLTEHQVANYIRQILEGLNYMHAQNIGHLGLTLGDVLVTRVDSEDIKIGDFALSARLPRGKTFIQEYGHPEYVAPEIASKKSASLASDMWSVGVISYILLSGISPFLGQNDRETLKNVQTGKINFLHDGFAKVSDDARDFISKLLVFDPSERLDVRAALAHPWLKITERPDRGESLSNIDRLRDYQRTWKSWYANASCRRHYRRRPMESCFTHPSKMIYPPDEMYTPPASPEREVEGLKARRQVDDTQPGKGAQDRLDIGSESSYQSGPDTYLLQLRDVDFPLRIRQYLRVGASRSPSLAANLRERHWGGFQIAERGTKNTYPQVVVRERRKFVDVMDEEIDDEKKGLGTRTLPLRLQREVGSLGYAHHQLENLKYEAWKDQASRDKTIGMVPLFREKIEDCVIKENDDVVFRCYAVGNPPPQYSWFRNDSILIESSRVQIKQDAEGRSELLLKPGKAYDVGVFKCAARNSHGVALCYARLKIGERPSRPEPPVCKQCTSDQAYVEWCSPKHEGNARTLCFCLEMKEPGESEWKKLCDVITQEFWVARDLQPSTTYLFRVSAKNQFGWSEESLSSDACSTKPEGSAEKIKLSQVHKYQEEIFECDPGHAIRKDTRVSLDYSQESSPVQLESGSLQELYSFSSEVSVGRFGAVVNGSSKKLSCNLALKTVLASSDTESLVLKEYEIMKSLCHERIVALKTASLHDDLLVLGMERLSGMDVLTYLTLRNHYNEDMVAGIIKQVFDGLEYLHFRGICYIELQPDNVVMTDANSCNIKLVDFGSASFVPRTGAVVNVGKNACIEYLAPEVLKGNEVCHATDIWSVGVLTYILLSGYSPFLGSDEEDTKSNVMYVRYHFDKLYKEASAEATRFIMQLFKRTPEKRPAISECLENKWMLPSEFMLRKRENSVFHSHKLQEFAAKFRAKKKNSATADKLSKLLGLSLSRSHFSDVDAVEG